MYESTSCVYVAFLEKTAGCLKMSCCVAFLVQIPAKVSRQMADLLYLQLLVYNYACENIAYPPMTGIFYVPYAS